MEGEKRACLGDGVEHHQTGAADWSAMPLDLVRIIAGLIDGIEDYSSFRAVCKPWRSATFSSYNDCPKSSKRRLEYPWLMLPPSPTGGKQGFSSVYTKKEFYLDLPEIHQKGCIGTPCGRLVTVDIHMNMHLFNPITRQNLPLPSLATMNLYGRPTSHAFLYLERALVLWDDDTPIVFVQCFHYALAMVRAGDTSWTTIEFPGSTIFTMDVFRGQVLVVTTEIFMVDLSVSPPRLKEFASIPVEINGRNPVYLVDVGGDLHFLPKVVQFKDSKLDKIMFSVYKFDMVVKSWEKVHTLGGWTAFVGLNSSIALPSSTNYPLCRPNCIYFADDFCKRYGPAGVVWGIFSVEGEVDVTENGDLDAGRWYSKQFRIRRKMIWPPPWLAPNLW